MNIDQKLTAIRDLIQQDVGDRGLARDPKDNLITSCPDDFAKACRSIAEHPNAVLAVVTGFYIPKANPPAGETDGPLGAVFLARAMRALGIPCAVVTDEFCRKAIRQASDFAIARICTASIIDGGRHGILWGFPSDTEYDGTRLTHSVALERVGPAADGCCYTMRGRDITAFMQPAHMLFRGLWPQVSIGIGDGGNEIGMGKIPHETIVKNIPNGDLIHCRVATDHLIVAGVSNWGAYGLAAGVALLRGHQLPAELFDPDREREILQVMVGRGPLVDGVTGQQTATVDGLTWEQYIQPLVEIGKIVRG
ncbi:MAG TPA: DUF4392 domain-containing protein [Gemmataceae bacterium]|nr:DUF4392 domain-containing protein [Gemmataceae bacterium]